MDSTFAYLARLSSLVIVAGSIGASAAAETRATSLEDMRRELAAGDLIVAVPESGRPVRGRLVHIGDTDLQIRLVDARAPHGRQDVTMPLAALQSLERPRDSARNGAAIGAGIGAGFGAAMFVQALVVDRNEVDEWAGAYLGATAMSTAIGALAGWAVDAARSKPHLKYNASPEFKTRISVQPVSARGRGIALAVSFSR